MPVALERAAPREVFHHGTIEQPDAVSAFGLNRRHERTAARHLPNGAVGDF